MQHTLEGTLQPKNYEDRLYKEWEEKGYFKPSVDKSKKPYTIVIPPPNITGKLHMGHALDDTIQDMLIRYKRMSGYNALWVPGSDHAAIATEAKIVAKLKEEGLTKEDLGREGFLKRAWEWKEEYGGAIQKQIRKLGCSCDWEHERFTMDEGLSEAVMTVFVNLYRKGLIYKGNRMINWCPYCKTSISDAEVEFEEEGTHLWHIRYPIKGEEGRYMIVATTRPETMLGDTGVAVHPEDERYQDVIGKTVVLPIMNKEIPIIADAFVEKEFGTGAVKLTPCHDKNDYESGMRHGLEMVELFDENGIMGSLVPELEGMDIYEARKKIVQMLEEQGYLVKIEDYTHNVGKCYRCHHTIEPKISDQWFVKMEELAKPANEAVRNKMIQFIPEKYAKTYFNWMDNPQDWCISRQIWWGHRIPAYYCEECDNMMVEMEAPKVCDQCGSTHIHQDTDTLDTWFSSALWPFSTLGWPHNTEDFNYFFPTATLVTGYDIIFFWVARMIFSSLEHTGKIPFENIFIHGIVRDSQGRKMSKSLGNGIDPIEIIDQYGTDSLRFSLILGISPGNDIRYMPEKLEAASNFANKLWNASKFVLMNLEDAQEAVLQKEPIQIEKLHYMDKWILDRMNTLVKEVTQNLDNFDLGVATQKIYDFIRNEFCDWYIELVKPCLYQTENARRVEVQKVLNTVLKTALQLLHPVMPFITEEIYTKLYHEDASIMISKWPEYKPEYEFAIDTEKAIEMQQLITGVRNIRSQLNVVPSKKTKVILVSKGDRAWLEESKDFLPKMVFAEDIVLQDTKEGIPDNAMSVLTNHVELYIPFQELVDIEAEKQRLQGEKTKLEAEITRASKMLSNPGFVSKAPQAKIAEEQAKLEKYKALLETVEERLQSM